MNQEPYCGEATTAYMLCWRPDRRIAWPMPFWTREDAERRLASLPDGLRGTLHIVETEGKQP